MARSVVGRRPSTTERVLWVWLCHLLREAFIAVFGSHITVGEDRYRRELKSFTRASARAGMEEAGP